METKAITCKCGWTQSMLLDSKARLEKLIRDEEGGSHPFNTVFISAYRKSLQTIESHLAEIISSSPVEDSRGN